MPDSHLRLVLMTTQPILGELIRAEIDGRPDMTIVEAAATLDDLPEILSRTAPDVVVCSVVGDDAFLERHAEYFNCPRPARLLVAFEDGRVASLWELRPRRTELGEFSTGLLVQALREIARR